MTELAEDWVLQVNNVSKQFASNVVLRDVSLNVRPGELVALLGENGAGKSTLSNIIAGILPPTAGSMTWRGEPYSPATPGDAIAQGIAMIHQELRLLPDLSAAENVVIGRWPTGPGGMVDHKRILREADVKLRELGFHKSPNTLVRHLSVAERQLVEIAKALMVDAKVLILDEPTAALGQDETDALFARITDLKAQGYSFIYISHRLDEIRRIAERIIVLRDGVLVAEHDTSDVDVDTLVAQMVGRSVERLFPDKSVPGDEVVLRVNGVNDPSGRFHDVSFEVHSGEVFGIAGIVGAGRTELVRAVSGAAPINAGNVEVKGSVLRSGSVGEAISHGLVMIPEDRRHQGLIQAMSIGENVMLANFDETLAGGRIDPSKVRALGTRIIERLKVKGAPDTPARLLSGGNQQKVVIGKWIERNPAVVVLDEPTRGIDVGARAAIYEVIHELAEKGLAVIVVSSDLDEVIGLAHRVMVLARGRDQGVLAGGDLTAEKVVALATV